MEIIESLENTKIKNICKLHQKKYRDETDNFIVEGDHLVNEAYKNGALLEVYALPTTNINMNIKVNYVTNNVMSKISSMESISNIIGIVKKYIPKTYGKRLLILDNIQDPGNLGTIIRSACAFNIDTIILGNTCVDLYNDKAIRATEGMLFNIDIMRFELESLISELKK
jgi:TrmH family RNA methyltransferase